MRRTFLAFAVLLVVVAGTLPAAAGIVRGFRTDAVVLTDGKVVKGKVSVEGDLVRIVTGIDRDRVETVDGRERTVSAPLVVEH